MRHAERVLHTVERASARLARQHGTVRGSDLKHGRGRYRHPRASNATRRGSRWTGARRCPSAPPRGRPCTRRGTCRPPCRPTGRSCCGTGATAHPGGRESGGSRTRAPGQVLVRLSGSGLGSVLGVGVMGCGGRRCSCSIGRARGRGRGRGGERQGQGWGSSRARGRCWPPRPRRRGRA